MVKHRHPMNKRFLAAMATYAAIAVLAAFTLDGKLLDGKLRLGVWILMGGLALKTLIAHKAHRE
jgi:low temperature requirement protein LtrA